MPVASSLFGCVRRSSDALQQDKLICQINPSAHVVSTGFDDAAGSTYSGLLNWLGGPSSALESVMEFQLRHGIPVTVSISLATIPVVLMNVACTLYEKRNLQEKNLIAKRTANNYRFSISQALIEGSVEDAQALERERYLYYIRSLLPNAKMASIAAIRLLALLVLRSAILKIPEELLSGKEWLWIPDLAVHDPLFILPIALSSYVLVKLFQNRKQLYEASRWYLAVPAIICPLLVYRLSNSSAALLLALNLAIYLSEICVLLIGSQRGRQLFGIKDPKITHEMMELNWDSMNVKFLKKHFDRLSLDYSTLKISDKFVDERRGVALYEKILQEEREKRSKGSHVAESRNTSDVPK